MDPQWTIQDKSSLQANLQGTPDSNHTTPSSTEGVTAPPVKEFHLPRLFPASSGTPCIWLNQTTFIWFHFHFQPSFLLFHLYDEFWSPGKAFLGIKGKDKWINQSRESLWWALQRRGVPPATLPASCHSSKLSLRYREETVASYKKLLPFKRWATRHIISLGYWFRNTLLTLEVCILLLGTTELKRVPVRCTCYKL